MSVLQIRYRETVFQAYITRTQTGFLGKRNDILQDVTRERNKGQD